MRARRLCGLTLAVAAAHLAGWRFAAGESVAAPPARAGVRWIALPARAAAAAASMPEPGPRATAANAGDDRVRPVAATRAAAAPVRHGAGGAERHGRARGAPPPLYPTRPPPSARVRYVLVQAGAASAPVASAVLDWSRDATSFSLRLAFDTGRGAPREWVGAGGFDGAGVAPRRLAERERGRERRHVDFERAAGRVRFSGAADDQALAPGLQDRWSWIAQLAAIADAAAARGRPPRPGTAWTIAVAGLRGEMASWTFRVLPDTALPPEAGASAALEPGRERALLHVVRAPEHPYDLRVEAWLAPWLHHLPIALRLGTPPSRWAIALWPDAGDDPAPEP